MPLNKVQLLLVDLNLVQATFLSNCADFLHHNKLQTGPEFILILKCFSQWDYSLGNMLFSHDDAHIMYNKCCGSSTNSFLTLWHWKEGDPFV